MDSYLDQILNLDDEDGIKIEYDHMEYELFFPKYIERIQKIPQIKFFTPRYNTEGKKIYYYHSTSLRLDLYDDREYVNDTLNIIKSLNEPFLLINGSLFPTIPTNGNSKNETLDGSTIGHSILIIYDKKKNQFYIIDSNGAASLYKYYDIAKRIFFDEPIEIKEAMILQRLESKLSVFENEVDGYCVAWSYLYGILFILSDTKDIEEITAVIMKKCNNSPVKLRKLIRNFTFECAY
jgi:hypothetical protein